MNYIFKINNKIKGYNYFLIYYKYKLNFISNHKKLQILYIY